jgi:hypothetical protein
MDYEEGKSMEIRLVAEKILTNNYKNFDHTQGK